MGAPNKHVMQSAAYNPNALIDHALAALNLSSDAKLAEITGTNPPIISKFRNRKLTIGDTFLVNLSELLNTPTKELKRIAGMIVDGHFTIKTDADGRISGFGMQIKNHRAMK